MAGIFKSSRLNHGKFEKKYQHYEDRYPGKIHNHPNSPYNILFRILCEFQNIENIEY